MKYQGRLLVKTALLSLCGINLLGVNQSGSSSQTFSLPVGGTVRVEAGAADIQVSVWPHAQVQIDAVGMDDDALSSLFMRETSSGVEVSASTAADGRFEIRVPAECSLRLSTQNGDIQVEGMLRGDLDVKTLNGDIELAEVDGDVKGNTANGDVAVGQVSGNCSLNTASGDISLGSVAGEVHINTAAGEISVGEVGQSITATTAGGDVSLGNTGGSAEITTAGGDIEIGQVAEGARLRTAGGDVELESASGRVQATTAGGNIELAGVQGSVKASTAGGDVAVMLDPTDQEESTISTAGGDIELSLPSGAAASIRVVIEVEGNWSELSEEFEIQSDWPISDYQKDPTRGEIRADIILGGGGQSIMLKTVNGNIRVGEAQ